MAIDTSNLAHHQVHHKSLYVKTKQGSFLLAVLGLATHQHAVRWHIDFWTINLQKLRWKTVFLAFYISLSTVTSLSYFLQSFINASGFLFVSAKENKCSYLPIALVNASYTTYSKPSSCTFSSALCNVSISYCWYFSSSGFASAQTPWSFSLFPVENQGFRN